MEKFYVVDGMWVGKLYVGEMGGDVECGGGGFWGIYPEQHLPAECIKMGGMRLFDRITWNPNQMNGQPCIRGMRLTVRRVVEAVAIYPNRDDLFRNYPELEPEDVRQALGFAAASLEDSATESDAA